MARPLVNRAALIAMLIENGVASTKAAILADRIIASLGIVDTAAA